MTKRDSRAEPARLSVCLQIVYLSFRGFTSILEWKSLEQKGRFNMRKKDADRTRAKQMFQSMSGREKVNYIFHYYWPHMAVTVVVLIMAVSFVQSARENARLRNCVYMGLQEEYYAFLQPAADELAQEGGWEEPVNYLSFVTGMSVDGLGGMQLAMYLTADQLDFVVCDEATRDMILEESGADCDWVPLEETALGQRAGIRWGLYLMTLNDTARGEKVQQFKPLLLTGTQQS